MKDVIFCTNLPSPYRVDFFNEFGKYCNLTVVYERHSSAERNSAWRGGEAKNFKEVYLELRLVGTDRAKGAALKNYVKAHNSDVLIFTNYVSPATMQTIIWCRLHGRRYYIEYDGGFNKKDPFPKGLIKKTLLKGAVGHLTTAEEHIRYLKTLGIPGTKIFKYPFSSINEQDIADTNVLNPTGRAFFKKKLGIREERMILTDIRFHDNKTYDILLRTARGLGTSVGVYIVGNKPMQMSDYGNIHFIGSGEGTNVSDYYAAADIFMALSDKRIGENDLDAALIYGLPVVMSDSCAPSPELVEDGDNGYTVNLTDPESIKNSITDLLSDTARLYGFGKRSFLKILECSSDGMPDKSKLMLWEGNKKCIKDYSKHILDIHYDKLIIAVGQFIHRKGFDVLMKAAANLSNDIGVYIIGGEPTEEYLQLLEELGLENLHFAGFKTKQELSLYYQAADCTAFPTREDIWGLITNESMSCGVPVVATQRCVSALEMVENNINGFVIPVDDAAELHNRITDALSLNAYKKTLDTAMRFTIQRMAETHVKTINNLK